jgi:hypothetical protein
MRVTPTGQSIYMDGNEAIRYGRDISQNATYAVWYHHGLRKYDEPAWAMGQDLADRLSVSVDYVLVVDQRTTTLYMVDKYDLLESIEEIDGVEQHVAKASDAFVVDVGDPNEHLNGNLYIESGNEVDEGYHNRKNEA